MDEITLDDKVYISSKRAAQITGYAKDYVGQLCREGRVQARLVGRNWYVLESSIRDHRFGAPANVSGAGKGEVIVPENGPVETGSLGAWKPSTYISEEIPELPALAQTSSTAPERIYTEAVVPEAAEANSEVKEAELQAPVSSDVISEMQSAWHDWFSRTNELGVSEEILLENAEDLDAALDGHEESEAKPLEPIQEEVPVHIGRTPTEASEGTYDSVPITIKTSSEDELIVDNTGFNEEDIERVPLKRSYTPAQSPSGHMRGSATQKSSSISSVQPLPITSVKSEERNETRWKNQRETMSEVPEGRIIRERRIKPSKGTSSTALRVLLISIAILSALVALAGTGKLSTLFSREHINYRILNYLGGQSSIQNPIK